MHTSTFSKWAARTDIDGSGANALALAIESAKAADRALVDLTVSNPTRCGFKYDEEAVLGALHQQQNLGYAAEPLGPLRARQAIAERYYAAKHISVAAERILLTASTSEAYGYLFRLLCNPGDEVLVPQPSYPLFDLLARMHDVRLVHYPLRMHDGWSIDLAACEALITERTKAIIVVHPNNPTGHFTSKEDMRSLNRLAHQKGLGVIADEVFLDYAFADRPFSFLQASEAEPPPLTFVLSGLSKVLAMPQMKLAWTVVDGPETACREALRRLEFIADTFLSVSAPVSNALDAWLPNTQGIQAQLHARIRANLRALDDLIVLHPLLGRLRMDGGWSVVVRVPAVEPDEDLAIALLEKQGLVVHPGSFYGLPDSGFLVISLLPPADVFREGVSRIATHVDSLANPESDR